MLIPIPKYNEPEVSFKDEKELQDAAYIKWYLNVKHWECPKCGTTMFGRILYCVYCKLKLGIDTPKPTDPSVAPSNPVDPE